MKLIKVQLGLFLSVIITYINLQLSSEALSIAKNPGNRDYINMFAKTLSMLNGDSTKHEQKLSPLENRDINYYTNVKKENTSIFNFSILVFVIGLINLLYKRKRVNLNLTEMGTFLLSISWVFIYISYELFCYWRFQSIGEGKIFDGRGFDPWPYFAILWLVKFGLSLISLLLNQLNKNYRNYSKIKTWCILDLTIGNIIIIFLHDSFNDLWPIINLNFTPSFG